MATADVTVRGAGIFGLCCAWACARRGARVQVIDPAGPGAGASGGVVGALAPHVPEQWNPKKQFQLESLLMAAAFWDDVAAAGGADPGYARLGRLQPLADAAAVALARSRAAGAETLWAGQAGWALRPARDHDGWLPDGGSGLVAHDTLSARIAPRAALAALVAALAGLGVSVRPDGRDAGAVIWATGAAGLADAGLGGGQGGQAALLAHDARGLPQLLVGGLHVVPHADGTVAVGSTSASLAAMGHASGPLPVDAALEALIARARLACPALATAPVVARWAGIRPRAHSRAPVLGPWPGRPGHFIANGGFKIGFGVAPAVGAAMAALVLEGRDTVPPGLRPTDSLRPAERLRGSGV